MLSKDYIFKGVKRQRSFFVSKNYRTTIFPSNPSNSSHQRVLDRKKIKIIDDHFDNPSIKEKYPCYPLLFQSNLTSDPFPPLDSIKSFHRPPRLFLTLEHLRLGKGGGEGGGFQKLKLPSEDATKGKVHVSSMYVVFVF